jgi:hypothetical protein
MAERKAATARFADFGEISECARQAWVKQPNFLAKFDSTI